MIDIDTIYTTLDDVYGSGNILDILVEFERTFDELDIYVYKNWIKGEIVEGPKVDRYWITVSLMYPYKMMPDPEGAMRLVDHGCKVWYSRDVLIHVTKIEGQDSYETDDEGKLRAKIIESPVWLVEVTMPRHFVDEKKTEKVQTGETSIDLDDVTDAYDENLNSEDAAKGNAADETTQQQNT
jgi:hypothetical protein